MASLNDIETKVHHIIDILDVRTIKTITGVLPLTFTSTEDKLRYWEIMGNDDVYEGQQGVGERTVNLFDVSQAKPVTSYRFMAYTFICQANTQYTINQNVNMLQIDIYTDSTKAKLLFRAYSTASYTFNSGEHTSLFIRTDQANPQDDYRDKQIMLVKGSTAPSSYVPFGYEIPISVNGTPQTFYIGDTPLTAGQSVSKTSTGVDISTTDGENTISTNLYNKPEMTIKYK